MDYLILAPTHWPPQRAVNVPSQRQRTGAKIWLACKRSSQASTAANFVLYKVRTWQPRLSFARTYHEGVLRIPRSTWAQARPDAFAFEQKQFVHLAVALVDQRACIDSQLYQGPVARYHDDG